MRNSTNHRLFMAFFFLIISFSAFAQTPKLAADINAGSNGSSVAGLAVFNNKLYFQADDGTYGLELWEYDGTNAPKMVADINPGSGWSSPAALTVYKNKLYFQADDGTHGEELWVYDGTNAPKMVADIYKGSGSGITSLTGEFIVFKDTLYFQADDSANGSELWKYDGVNAPSMAADINKGSGNSLPKYFAVYNNVLYFQADDGTYGDELWKYTGTSAPAMVADIWSGSNGSSVEELIVFNGLLYFTADDGTNGKELWQYNDNTNKAKMTADINSGSGSSFPAHYCVYKNKLYFSANDGTYGDEVWSYSGSGTPGMIYDINPTSQMGSFPADLIVFNDTLYFGANDGTYGLEPWKYGGSGTPKMVADINPGSDGSFFTQPAVYKNALYFSADDGSHGIELWKLGLKCSPVTGTFVKTACDSFKWVDNITYKTSNNTAKYTYTSAAGCDSVVTLNLTIAHAANTDTFASACNSFTWYGKTYTASAIAKQKFNSKNGCDSTVTLHLVINKPTSSTLSISACGSYTWYNTAYTKSTVATHTVTNASGCDSVITLKLTIYNPAPGDTFARACESFTWHDTTYTSSTQASATYKTKMGCDSVVTLHLTITEPVSYSLNIIDCNPHTVNGVTYSKTGIYTQVIQRANDCDSTLTINYAKKAPKDTVSITECRSYTINDKTFTQSGYYQVAFNGCDPVTLDLTILKPDTTVLFDTACNSYVFNNFKYEKSGTYFAKFKNKAGCDSIVVLNLIIHNSYLILDKKFSCGPFKWIDGNTYTASHNLAGYSYKSSTGCDSTIVLDLTIGEPSAAEIHVSDCNAVNINGQLIGTTGTYTQTLVNHAGCDSILTIDYVNTSKDSTITADVCDKYVLNGITYTNSGTYTQKVKNCPSTITLNLKVLQNTSSSASISACKSYTWNGETYTASGTYIKHFNNAAGCDSTATLDLKILKGSSSSVSVIACGNAPYSFLGHTYSKAGTYNDTVPDSHGCDSIVTLNLTFSSYLRVGNPFAVPADTKFPIIRSCISRDGNTLSTISNSQVTNEYTLSIYTWDGKSWNQKVSQTISNIDPSAKNIYTYHSLSKDGKTVAISGYSTDKNGTEIKSATLIYNFNGSSLVPKGNPLTGSDNSNILGGAVSLSADGNIVCIGIDNRNPSGVDADTSCIKVYYFDGSSWKPKGTPIYIQVSAGLPHYFNLGGTISMSDDGITLAVGGHAFRNILFEIDSVAAVFRWNGTAWVQKGSQISLKDLMNGRDNKDFVASSIQLSSDGSVLALGISGASEGKLFSCIRVFTFKNNQWVLRWNMQKDNNASGYLGAALRMSDDGNTLLTADVINTYYNYQATQAYLFKWHGKTYDDTLNQSILYKNTNLKSTVLSGNGNLFGINVNAVEELFDACSQSGTGIDEKHADIPGYDKQFTIYPNPNKGEFVISNPMALQAPGTKVQYSIYSLQGKLIREGQLTKTENTISIADAPPGMYLIRLQAGNGQGCSTMVVKQ